MNVYWSFSEGGGVEKSTCGYLRMMEEDYEAIFYTVMKNGLEILLETLWSEVK